MEISSSKNKKPCGDCPYLKTSEYENYHTLGTVKEDFDGDFVHNCHKLDPNFTNQSADLGCVGSKLWGEKLQNPLLHPNLKDLVELEISIKDIEEMAKSQYKLI